MSEKKFKWVVEFEVSEIWVEDGFDLTEERALEMLNADLSFASSHELGARIVKAPSPADIKQAQGYEVYHD